MTTDPLDLRCSFCNKGQRFVRKLIAGPNVQICDECVDICVGILGEEPHEAAQARATARVSMTPYHVVSPCSLCHMPAPLEDMLVVHSRGVLCPGCVGAIEAAAATVTAELDTSNPAG